jgi:hypothetical protein
MKIIEGLMKLFKVRKPQIKVRESEAFNNLTEELLLDFARFACNAN